jgi:hypothetical protein
VTILSGDEAGSGRSIGLFVDGADDGCWYCSDGNVPLGEIKGIV